MFLEAVQTELHDKHTLSLRERHASGTRHKSKEDPRQAFLVYYEGSRSYYHPHFTMYKPKNQVSHAVRCCSFARTNNHPDIPNIDIASMEWHDFAETSTCSKTAIVRLGLNSIAYAQMLSSSRRVVESWVGA